MNEPAVWIAVTVMVSNLAATIASVLLTWLNRRRLSQVHGDINGKMDDLLQSNGVVQRARGREEGRAEGRKPNGPP